jgi:hypothetical protein
VPTRLPRPPRPGINLSLTLKLTVCRPQARDLDFREHAHLGLLDSQAIDIGDRVAGHEPQPDRALYESLNGVTELYHLEGEVASRSLSLTVAAP